MKTPFALHIRQPLHSQDGLTLIELMISLVIGMVLVLFISTLFVNSKASFRLNDDNARLQEDAGYAMGLIGRNLMQAGFGNVRTSATTDFVGQALKGCSKGFKNTGVPLDLACATTGTANPAFQVSYRVNDLYDANTGAGADCNGQKVDSTTSAAGIAINSFFLATKSGDTVPSLYCNGNGNTVSQPVLRSVEAMVLTYGVDANGDYVPDQYLGADAVEALTPNAINRKNWDQVVSVQVCLLVASANNVTDGNRGYTDCSGAAQTATDNKLRRAFTKVFALRNNATPSLVY